MEIAVNRCNCVPLSFAYVGNSISLNTLTFQYNIIIIIISNCDCLSMCSCVRIRVCVFRVKKEANNFSVANFDYKLNFFYSARFMGAVCAAARHEPK